MKVGFDAKRLFHNKTGLGNYSRSLVSNLRTLNPELDMYLFAPDPQGSPYQHYGSEDYEIVDGSGKFLWRLKNVVKDIERLGIEIYHGLSNELPVGISKSKKTKSIVSIHDLIFLRFPEFYPKVDRILYKEKSKRACRDATHIIAVSQATKNDIVEFYGISPAKISVVYQAYDDLFDLENNLEISPIDRGQRSYILSVGSIIERKNLRNLILALSMFPKSSRPILKVVGKGGAYEKKTKKLLQELDIVSDVEFKGHVSNEELKSLYLDAACMVYPSFYEGFGIPIVEALICGTPVVTSNVSSMPEAAAGLAKLVDPNSVDEIHSAIERVLSENSRITKEQRKSIFNKFNSTRHGEEVLRIYNKILKC